MSVEEPIRLGDFVVVEADRGEDVGVVCEMQQLPAFFREGGTLASREASTPGGGGGGGGGGVSPASSYGMMAGSSPMQQMAWPSPGGAGFGKTLAGAGGGGMGVGAGGVKHIIRHALPQEYSVLPVKLAEEQSIVEVGSHSIYLI
jgi:hypothetical protein